MVQEHTLSIDDLIYPLFVEEGINDVIPISMLPGVHRIPESLLAEEIKALASEGIKAVLLFGIPHFKDATGEISLHPDTLLSRMIRTAKNASPSMVIIADCCFCEYTSHGHCGVLRNNTVDNDLTLALLSKQALAACAAGADIIAPSSMMDGQVRAIRAALDAEGYAAKPIMAYSAKFASAFYGPFRSAVNCELKGDRKTYQMDPANGREAIRELLCDEVEGADILMVKPGLLYLDIITRIRDRTDLPIAAYHVSGEYASIKFAAQAGAIDEQLAVMDVMGAFKRAGAKLIITYFARDIARLYLNAH